MTILALAIRLLKYGIIGIIMWYFILFCIFFYIGWNAPPFP